MLPNCDGSYNSYEEITRFLRALDRQNTCRGILNGAYANVHVTGRCSVKKDGDVWRATGCTSLASRNSKSELCPKCIMALKYLRKRALKPTNAGISKRKLDVANTKLKRCHSRELVMI